MEAEEERDGELIMKVVQVWKAGVGK